MFLILLFRTVAQWSKVWSRFIFVATLKIDICFMFPYDSYKWSKYKPDSVPRELTADGGCQCCQPPRTGPNVVHSGEMCHVGNGKHVLIVFFSRHCYFTDSTLPVSTGRWMCPRSWGIYRCAAINITIRSSMSPLFVRMSLSLRLRAVSVLHIFSAQLNFPTSVFSTFLPFCFTFIPADTVLLLHCASSSWLY